MKLTGTAYCRQMSPLYTVFYLGLMMGLFFLCFAHDARSQVTSEKGWIIASANTGCADLSISITHQRSGVGELQFSFEGDINDPIASDVGEPVGGSFEFGETKTYTYESPGNFVIFIFDQTNGLTDEERIDRLEITVLPNDPPKTSVTSCQGRSILINFDKSNDPFNSYRILFGDGAQETFSGNESVEYTYAVSGTYEVLVQGLLDNGESSSCKLAKHEVSAFDQLPIPQLNSLVINDLETITFNYEPLNPGLQYYVEIDSGSGFEVLENIDALTDTNRFQYSSSNLNFQDLNYRFRIRAEDACGLFQEFSEVGNSIAFDISYSNINTSIDFNMQWSTNSIGFTQLEFFTEDQLLSTFTQNETSDFLFSTIDCRDLGDFFLQGTFNGVLSTSMVIDPFRTTALTLPPPPPPRTDLIGANANLTFPETGFISSNFQVFRKDIDDQFSLLNETIGPTYVDISIPLGLSEVCYRITYEDACGNISAPSEDVCLALGSSLGIPNAFSPNNDGINDVFKVKDANYLSFTLEIFNRWGNLVFKTTNPSTGWDGYFEGRPAPTGSYTYRVSFQGTDKVPFTRAGSVLLIR